MTDKPDLRGPAPAQAGPTDEIVERAAAGMAYALHIRACKIYRVGPSAPDASTYWAEFLEGVKVTWRLSAKDALTAVWPATAAKRPTASVGEIPGELRKLSKEATPGPWFEGNEDDDDSGGAVVLAEDGTSVPWSICSCHGSAGLCDERGSENAAFIVAAVNFIRTRLSAEDRGRTVLAHPPRSGVDRALETISAIETVCRNCIKENGMATILSFLDPLRHDLGAYPAPASPAQAAPVVPAEEIRRAALEEAARLVEEHQETDSNLIGKHLTPRGDGNRAGLIFATGIRSLIAQQSAPPATTEQKP